MEHNEAELILSRAEKLLEFYEEHKDLLPMEHQLAVATGIDRLKRDLARVRDGSRPELVLSVKMGSVGLKDALIFLLEQD